MLEISRLNYVRQTKFLWRDAELLMQWKTTSCNVLLNYIIKSQDVIRFSRQKCLGICDITSLTNSKDKHSTPMFYFSHKYAKFIFMNIDETQNQTVIRWCLIILNLCLNALTQASDQPDILLNRLKTVLQNNINHFNGKCYKTFKPLHTNGVEKSQPNKYCYVHCWPF